jgi:hypothetical protein
MMPFTLRFIVCVSLALLALAAEPQAQQGRTLASFVLSSANGDPVASASLVRQGPWVLIVTPHGCRPCDASVTDIDAALATAQASRVAVIVSGASAAQLTAMRDRGVALSAAGWFSDEASAAMPALRARGTPLVIGLLGDRVMWTRNAAGMAAPEVQSLVTSWIR